MANRETSASSSLGENSASGEVSMIEMLDGFADNVVAAKAISRVTREDYESVLIPRVEAAAKRHPKLRCYFGRRVRRNSP
jgi:hypothetical protein